MCVMVIGMTCNDDPSVALADDFWVSSSSVSSVSVVGSSASCCKYRTVCVWVRLYWPCLTYGS